MSKKTYRYNPESKEMELVNDSASTEHHHFVRGDMPEFVSPIDGAVIGSRSQYRNHTKRYGVVPQAELCPKELAHKVEERRQMRAGVHPSQKAARIEAIKGAYECVRNESRSRSRYG